MDFSPDDVTARKRFREAVDCLGWEFEQHDVDAKGPDDRPLGFDVACSQSGDPANVLVVSSGIHGVEAYFGSAVQLALLRHWHEVGAPPVKVVLLHGLNAYGFAWRRRFNEDNVDLNRNFLLPGQAFEGAPDGYAELDSFLNPRKPPARFELFHLKAAWLIATHGMKKLRGAIASGQYDFSLGLFFGGKGPASLQTQLSQILPRLLEGSQQVVHLDFHTGLGASGTWKLLIDYVLSDRQREQLASWFGTDAFETNQKSDIAYDAQGGFGQWCVAQKFAPEYLFSCAEFGTYSPVKVLAGLRAENQAHHWGNSAEAASAKTKLTELFCPASPRWRSQVIQESRWLVDRAIRGLTQPPTDG